MKSLWSRDSEVSSDDESDEEVGERVSKEPAHVGEGPVGVVAKEMSFMLVMPTL